MTKDIVFVTGGTGFLGRHLVPQLIEQGFAVRLLVRPTSDVSWLSHPDITLIKGDITEAQTIADAMSGCRYAVHAAGYFRFWGPNETFAEVNQIGTRYVVGAALGSAIERLIHISSIAVVGNPEPGATLDEDAECYPQDPYQHSKLAAERYVQNMTQTMDLPAVILRPGAFYGPGSEYGFNRLFVLEPMRGWRVKVEGGRHLTFPVYVPDVARAIILALTHGRVGEIYNISDQPYSHNQVNHIVSELLGISQWRLNVPRGPMLALAALQEAASKITGQEPFYPLNLRHYVFNDWNVVSAKAAAELNFTPTPLEEGLHETIKWLIEDD